VAVQAVDGNADRLDTAPLKFLEFLLVKVELPTATGTPVERIDDSTTGLPR
jgi:hypothetical protein